MLFLLDRLQGQGVVAKWILDVSKVGLVRDNLLAANAIVHLGTQFDASLVISELHQCIVSFLAVIGNAAFGGISQALVDESRQFKRCVVFQSVIGRQGGYLGTLLDHFGFVDYSCWSIVSNRVGAVEVSDWTEQISSLTLRQISPRRVQLWQ